MCYNKVYIQLRKRTFMRALRIEEEELFVRENGVVSLEALCERFHVSLNTIRRDIACMVERGSVEKVFGGVRPASHRLTPFHMRDALLSAEKQRIGLAAAELIHPGDVVYIGPGSTSYRLLDGISALSGVTVITNNLRAMEHASTMANVTLIALPGQLFTRNISFNDPDQPSFFDRYNVRIAFMSVAGISLKRGVTYDSIAESDFCRHVLTRCSKRVLMADRTKFDVVGLTTTAELSSFDVLITDAAPSEAYLEEISRAGVRLIVAGQPE